MSILPDVLCPVCEKPAMSMIRRLILDPFISPRCRSCGARVGIPVTPALLVCVPVGILLGICIALISEGSMLSAWALALAIGTPVGMFTGRLVKLVPK
jgi:hypothetical protein